jgi:hypothetical protein
MGVIVSDSQSNAQVLACKQVHHQNTSTTSSAWSPPEKSSLHHNELSLTLLKKNGFELSPDGTELFDRRALPGQQLLGKVKVLNAKYLFQWADRAYQKSLLKSGGISDSYMKDILSAGPQSAGIGFYVSIDPMDSSSYGNALTSFQTKGHLLVLETLGNSKDSRMDDPEIIRRLSASGIDATRYEEYEQNWLSIIGNRHLKQPLNMPNDLVSGLDNIRNLTEVEGPYIRPQDIWLRTFSKDHFIRRYFLEKNPTIDELEYLFEKAVLEWQGIRKAGTLFSPSKMTGLAETALKLLGSSQSPETALRVLTLLKKSPMDNTFLLLFGSDVESKLINSPTFSKIVSKLEFEKIAKAVEQLSQPTENQFFHQLESLANAQSTNLPVGQTSTGTASARQRYLIGLSLRYWMSLASSEGELISRAYWSLNFYLTLFPSERSKYPQFKK